MDRIEAMKVFVAAVDQGSLAGAGRALKRSPAAVSRAIAFLEGHVGAPLLARTTRAMRLTDAGERYAEASRRILAELEAADSLAAGAQAAPQGILTLSAPPVAGETVLQPIVEAFLHAYPQVSLRLLLLDRHVALVDEGVDVALRIAELPDSSLVAVKVGAELRRVVVASPAYLEAHPPIARPADLAGHRIIAMANFGIDRWVFPPEPGSTAARTVSFSPRLAVNTVSAAAAAAAAGLGVTRLYSFHVADKVRDGALRIVLAGDEPPPQPAHLVAQPASLTTARTRAFMDFAAPRLRAAFARLADEALRLPAPGPAA
ncbi:LysR family transcriptional regulator [Caulobacter sp. KR2-114]|uniref:LysR family transcriptional regulator n=1 Tax=Caulobacter sp. KR2-114 TaxID=3400912 RepID=UPI003BFB0600